MLKSFAEAYKLFQEIVERAGDEMEIVQLTPEVLYSFTRSQRAETVNELLKLSDGDFQRIILEGITQEFVNASVRDALDAIMQEWSDFAAKQLLESTQPFVEDINKLLEAAISDSDKRKAILQIYVKNAHNLNDFFNELQKDDEAGIYTPVVKTLFNIYLLTDKFMPVAVKIFEIAEAKAGEEPFNSSILVSFDPDDWTDAVTCYTATGIHNSKLPDHIPGDTEGEKAANFAILQERVYRSYPMDRFNEDIKKESSGDMLEVKNFLQDNPEFNMGSSDVNSYSSTISDAQSAIIKSVQRLYRITPVLEIIKALYNANIRSSHDIVRIGENDFSTV